MVGVYVTEHVPDASVHCPEPLKVPAPSVENATVPPGVDGVPLESLSVTVAVHVVAWPAVTGLVQLTLVELDRGWTVSAELPLLPWWIDVVANVAEMLCAPDTVVGVTVTEHVALFVLDAARVHVPVIVSLESELTVVVVPTPGFDCVPASVSVTVIVAVVLCDTSTGFGEKLTVVVVVRLLMVSLCVAGVRLGFPCIAAVKVGLPAFPSL